MIKYQFTDKIIDKAKKSNVLRNAEQMHFVGCIEKKIPDNFRLQSY